MEGPLHAEPALQRPIKARRGKKNFSRDQLYLRPSTIRGISHVFDYSTRKQGCPETVHATHDQDLDWLISIFSRSVIELKILEGAEMGRHLTSADLRGPAGQSYRSATVPIPSRP